MSVVMSSNSLRSPRPVVLRFSIAIQIVRGLTGTHAPRPPIIRRVRGSGAVVAHDVANVRVAGSNPVFRSEYALKSRRTTAATRPGSWDRRCLRGSAPGRRASLHRGRREGRGELRTLAG